jgi:WD40 repeat protein
MERIVKSIGDSAKWMALFGIGLWSGYGAAIRASELTVCRGSETRAFSVAYSPDGRLLAAVYEDGSLHVWDVAEGKPLVTVAKAHEDHCRAVAWEADGTAIWTTGDEGTVKRWDSRTGRPVGRAFNVEKPYSVAVYGSPPMLALGSRNANVQLVDPHSGAIVRRLSGHGGPVRSVAVAAGGKLLASVGHDNRLKIWNLVTGECLYSIEGTADGRLFAVAISPNGHQIAFAGDGGRISLADSRTGQRHSDWQAHDREIRSLSFSCDGRLLASAGEDVDVRVWHEKNGSLLKSLTGQAVKAYSVAFSPVDDTVAVGRADGRIELWHDITTGDPD